MRDYKFNIKSSSQYLKLSLHLSSFSATWNCESQIIKRFLLLFCLLGSGLSTLDIALSILYILHDFWEDAFDLHWPLALRFNGSSGWSLIQHFYEFVSVDFHLLIQKHSYIIVIFSYHKYQAFVLFFPFSFWLTFCSHPVICLFHSLVFWYGPV